MYVHACKCIDTYMYMHRYAHTCTDTYNSRGNFFWMEKKKCNPHTNWWTHWDMLCHPLWRGCPYLRSQYCYVVIKNDQPLLPIYGTGARFPKTTSQFYRHLRGQFYRHALRFRGQFIPTYVNA